MSYQLRALLGFCLILFSGFILWFGSPDRVVTPDRRMETAFLFTFAIGFILFSMGVLASKDPYSAMLSGFVLYFIVGGLFTLFLYLDGSGLMQYTLSEAGEPHFWREAARVSSRWPLFLVRWAELFGWDTVPI